MHAFACAGECAWHFLSSSFLVSSSGEDRVVGRLMGMRLVNLLEIAGVDGWFRGLLYVYQLELIL